jgi:hypothetical protein
MNSLIYWLILLRVNFLLVKNLFFKKKTPKPKKELLIFHVKKIFKLNKKITKFKLNGLSIKYSKKKERDNLKKK